jgi:FixJ family two-component response regulator
MHSTLDLVAVIDDDSGMRKSIERLLQASGYATTAFASAEEFLQSGQVERAMSLVLDVHLEGMSGISLYRCLNPGETRVPVVFVTARDDAAARTEAISLGCIDYLLKPFEARLLTEALERCKAWRARQIQPPTKP